MRAEIQKQIEAMRISAFLKKFPHAQQVLYQHTGESCFHCPARNEETLEVAFHAHQVDRETFYHDLDKLGGNWLDEGYQSENTR